MTHHRLGKLDQPGCDSTTVHQDSSQHKKWNCHQRETVHSVVNISVKQGEIPLLIIEPEQKPRSGQKPEKYRQADHQEQQKERKEKCEHSVVLRNGLIRITRQFPFRVPNFIELFDDQFHIDQGHQSKSDWKG